MTARPSDQVDVSIAIRRPSQYRCSVPGVSQCSAPVTKDVLHSPERKTTGNPGSRLRTATPIRSSPGVEVAQLLS